jgi:hypothetical protein
MGPASHPGARASRQRASGQTREFSSLPSSLCRPAGGGRRRRKARSEPAAPGQASAERASFVSGAQSEMMITQPPVGGRASGERGSVSGGVPCSHGISGRASSRESDCSRRSASMIHAGGSVVSSAGESGSGIRWGCIADLLAHRTHSLVTMPRYRHRRRSCAGSSL